MSLVVLLIKSHLLSYPKGKKDLCPDNVTLSLCFPIPFIVVVVVSSLILTSLTHFELTSYRIWNKNRMNKIASQIQEHIKRILQRGYADFMADV